MIERPGRVIAIHAEVMDVRVDTAAAAACSHCASKKTCNGDKDHQFISLPLQPDVHMGDEVILSIPERTVNISALLIYLLPALSLLLGAALGEGIRHSNPAAMLGALLGLIAGLCAARLLAKLFSQDSLAPDVHPCFQTTPHPTGSHAP